MQEKVVWFFLFSIREGLKLIPFFVFTREATSLCPALDYFLYVSVMSVQSWRRRRGAARWPVWNPLRPCDQLKQGWAAESSMKRRRSVGCQ